MAGIDTGIIPPMTERGQNDAAACPFVAFEDERDERSSRPDHRHRCYADLRPAPRALAHQDAYCLSPAFATCPTFQDWARRESARARMPAPSVRGRTGDDGPEVRAAPRRRRDWASPPPWAADGGGRGAGAEDAGRGFDDGSGARVHDDAAGTSDRTGDVEPLPVTPGAELWATATLSGPVDWEGEGPDDGVPGRDEPNGDARDEGAGRGRRGDAGDDARATPPFLAPRAWPTERPTVRPGEGAGLAESLALAAAGETVSDDDAEEAEPPPRRVAVVPGGPGGGVPTGRVRGRGRVAPPDVRDARPLPRGTGNAVPAGPAGRAGRARVPSDDDAAFSLHGPDWERPRRFEAYPTLRTRVGLPNVPTVALGFAALVIAALALFFIPPLLLRPGGAGDAGGSGPATPSATVGPSVVSSPTPVPSPTPEIYTIQAGDTLSTVAAKYKIPLAKLIAANPSIKNPDVVAIGDEIIIPSLGSNDVLDAGGSASASPSAP